MAVLRIQIGGSESDINALDLEYIEDLLSDHVYYGLQVKVLGFEPAEAPKP